MALLWTDYNGTSRSWTNLIARTTARGTKKNAVCLWVLFQRNVILKRRELNASIRVVGLLIRVNAWSSQGVFSVASNYTEKTDGNRRRLIRYLFTAVGFPSSGHSTLYLYTEGIWRNSTDHKTHKIERKTYKTVKLFTSIKFYIFILYCYQQIQNCFTNYHTPTCFDTIVPI